MTATVAERELDSLAKSIQARTHTSYEKAFTEAMEQRPDLYAAYEGDPTARYQAAQQRQQEHEREARQASENYAPGRGLELAADDRLAKEARSIRASEPAMSYEQAYTKALERNPSLYDSYTQGAVARELAASGVRVSEQALEPRQFGSNDAMWSPVSTPAGQLRIKAGTALEGEIDAALRPLLNQYPRVPRDFLLAELFAANKALRKRAQAACRLGD